MMRMLFEHCGNALPSANRQSVCIIIHRERKRERERQIQSIKDIELQPAAAVHAVKTLEKTCSNSKQVQVRWHLRGDD